MSKEPFDGSAGLPQTPSAAAPLKYARSALLALYHPSPPLRTMLQTAGDAAAVLSEGHPPVLSAALGFPRPLGEDPSFRPHLKERRTEAVPEWYQSAHSTAASSRVSPPLAASPGKEVKPQAKETRPVRVRLTDGSRNVPSDIQLTGTDVVRPKAEEISPKPDSDFRPILNPDAQPWSGIYTEARLPLYHVTVLREKMQRGDPFAGILLESGVSDACGYMSQPSGSRAAEKVWFYKDPQGLTQGPFSSVEMFNWFAAGYFSLDLPVAVGSKAHFQPLSTFVRRASMRREKEAEDASSDLKMMLGVVPDEDQTTGGGCRG